jgi:hypothetical protein
VDGKTWTQLDPKYPHYKVLYEAYALCKDVFPKDENLRRPVSGGFRYEGVWKDLTKATHWRLVESEAYADSQGRLVGWSCMVMKEEGVDSNEVPGDVWCGVTCCP